jgi:hypothetical protein
VIIGKEQNMDNFSVQESNPPSDKPLVYSEKDPAIFFAKIRNFFNRKIVKIILFLIIVLVITIPVGLFVNQKFTENKIITNEYQLAKQKLINMGTLQIGETGMSRFYGEVKKIQSNEITLQTKEGVETIKVNKDTVYTEIPFVLEGKKDVTKLGTSKKASLSAIKINDLLDIAGEGAGNDFTTRMIIIYKIP